MPAFTLAMIAMQIGSAYYNYKKGCDQSKKLQDAQQAFTEKKNREGIANARFELERLLSAQREIETQMYEDRIVNINNSFKSNLELIAFTSSLKDWPLLVPPFVMKNEALPMIASDNSTNEKSSSRVAMHCILTNCADTLFNLKIFPELEESLSQYFCSYWNMSSTHPILFYKRAWKNDMVDMGAKVPDIKCHLRSLPTIVISPVITKEKGLFFRYSLWGMNNNQNSNDEFIDCEFIPNGLLYEYKCNDDKLSDNKDSILSEVTPVLKAFISSVADSYYWHFDKMPFMLPQLLANRKIVFNDESCLVMFKTKYEDILNSCINDSDRFRHDSLRILILYESVQSLLSKDQKERIRKSILESIFIERGISDVKHKTISDLFNATYFTSFDKVLLRTIKKVYPEYNERIAHIINNLGVIQKEKQFDIDIRSQYGSKTTKAKVNTKTINNKRNNYNL
ncbi:MAG: hypothetical protein R3Y68_02155 [Rikenellaceae bacterium]